MTNVNIHLNGILKPFVTLFVLQCLETTKLDAFKTITYYFHADSSFFRSNSYLHYKNVALSFSYLGISRWAGVFC